MHYISQNRRGAFSSVLWLHTSLWGWQPEMMMLGRNLSMGRWFSSCALSSCSDASDSSKMGAMSANPAWKQSHNSTIATLSTISYGGSINALYHCNHSL